VQAITCTATLSAGPWLYVTALRVSTVTWQPTESRAFPWKRPAHDEMGSRCRPRAPDSTSRAHVAKWPVWTREAIEEIVLTRGRTMLSTPLPSPDHKRSAAMYSIDDEHESYSRLVRIEDWRFDKLIAWHQAPTRRW
jgi:hypothetical protein